jgi:hypothetical protein
VIMKNLGNGLMIEFPMGIFDNQPSSEEKKIGVKRLKTLQESI